MTSDATSSKKLTSSKSPKNDLCVVRTCNGVERVEVVFEEYALRGLVRRRPPPSATRDAPRPGACRLSGACDAPEALFASRARSPAARALVERQGAPPNSPDRRPPSPSLLLARDPGVAAGLRQGRGVDRRGEGVAGRLRCPDGRRALRRGLAEPRVRGPSRPSRAVRLYSALAAARARGDAVALPRDPRRRRADASRGAARRRARRARSAAAATRRSPSRG